MFCDAVNAMQFATYVKSYVAYPGNGVIRSCGQEGMLIRTFSLRAE